jgi:hypothetical protein
MHNTGFLIAFEGFDVKHTVMCISHLDKLKAPLSISKSSRKERYIYRIHYYYYYKRHHRLKRVGNLSK